MNLRFSWLLLLWVVTVGDYFLYGENQGTADPLARLTTKGVVGDTSAPVSVPVYLETFGDTRLKLLVLEVRYPQNALLFTTVEKGFLLESADFRVNAEPSAASRGDNLQTAQITVTSAAVEKAIPQGVIFYLHFGVAPKMAEELKRKSEAASSSSPDSERETVALESTFREARTSDGTPLPQDRLVAETEPVVLFAQVPLSACFFYMH